MPAPIVMPVPYSTSSGKPSLRCKGVTPSIEGSWVIQCEKRIGSGGFDNRLLVAPPSTNSRSRECP